MTEQQMLSIERYLNEPQGHYKTRRRLLRYALDSYTRKRFGNDSAPYIDYVKIIFKAANFE